MSAMLMISFALEGSVGDKKNVFLRQSCSWDEIVSSIATTFHINKSRILSLTLYDGEDDDLSQPVNSDHKFWKYGLNYVQTSGNYFLVELGSGDSSSPPAPAVKSNVTVASKLPLATKADRMKAVAPSQRGVVPAESAPASLAQRVKRMPSQPQPQPQTPTLQSPALIEEALPPPPPVVQKEQDGLDTMQSTEKGGESSEAESGQELEESELLQAFVANDKVAVNRLMNSESIHDIDEQRRTLIHMACRQGMDGLVKCIVELGGDPDVQDKAGRTPLHYACKYNHISTVQYLIMIKANLNIADKDKMLALHYACISGCSDIAKLLVESGNVDIDFADKRGNTAVHYCCDTRNYPLAEWLTEVGGANIDKINDDGLSAFGIVHNSGSVGFASVLMEKAAAVSVQRNTLNKTKQLLQAGKRGEWAAVLNLVMDGAADIHAADENQKTVLSYAAGSGSLEIVKAIVERGGKIQQKDEFGKTCLHYCCEKGHYEVAKYLVVDTGRAALNDPDRSCRTELYYACTGVGSSELVKLLAQSGGDFRSAAEDPDSIKSLCKSLAANRDLVEWLIKECNFDIELLYYSDDDLDRSADSDEFYSWAWEVKKRIRDWLTKSLCEFLQGRPDDITHAQDLIRRGADVNVGLPMGCCPLHDACVRGKDEYVTFLIKQGAHCTAADSFGNTPLHIASYFGHIEIIRWLKKSGAFISAKNNAGYTPLHFACAAAQLPVVKWLIDRGANIQDQANNGFTPFLLACESGDLELVQWIEPRTAAASFVPDGDHTNAAAYKPIDHSVHSGNVELVQWWLHKRSCPQSVGNNYLNKTKQVKAEKTAARVVADFRLCCVRGEFDACKKFILSGININCTDTRLISSRELAPLYALDAMDPLLLFHGLPPLYICSSLGHEDIVNLLLEQPTIRCGDRDSVSRSAVHIACLKGYSNIVTRLLKTGQFSELILDKDGNSLLHLAVMSKNESLIISLAERYPLLDEDMKNEDRQSSLAMAAELKLSKALAWFHDNPKHARLIDELCNACTTGNIVVMNRLVTQGANINIGDNDGMRPIHFAAINNQLLIVTRLLELRCNLNTVNVFQMSAMHLAAESGHIEVVRCLSYGGADMNLIDVNGMTPFLVCCSHGAIEIASFLIQQGADTSTVNRKGQNALHLACLSESFPMVKCIIERCSDVVVDARDKNGLRPLDVATEKFQMEMITCIQCAQIIYHEQRVLDLERKNELELQKAEERAKAQAEMKEIYMKSEGEREIARMHREGLKDANTSMFLEACLKNQNDIIKEMLIADTVNPNCQNSDGFTALHLACISGNTAIVKLLIQAHVIIDAKNIHGCTALYYACATGNDEIALILVENGADFTIIANDGTTALQCICAKDRATLLRMLFKRDPNIDVNVKEAGGSSLLQVACINGSESVVPILLKKGAIVQGDVDVHNSSLLHLAAVTGSIKLCQVLLDYSAKIDERDGDGFTPLMRACTAGQKKLAQFLVSRGASIHDCDPVGNTCLHLAAISGSVEVCSWLTELGLNIFAFNDDHTNVIVIVKVKRHLDLIKWLKAYLESIRSFLDICSGGDAFGIKNFMETSPVHPLVTNECFATAMHFACGAGDLPACKYLFSVDCSIDETDDEGLTPLHWACAGGHEAVVKWLLGRGAKIEHKSHDGRNLLHRAAFHGQERLITVLLNNRSFPYPIDDKTDNGFTPFFDACTSGHLKVAELLLLKGSNLLEMLPNGYNIVHILCRQGRNLILSWLLGNYSVSLSKYLDYGSDNNSTTPFMCACINGSVDTLNALEANHLDISAAMSHQTRKGDTALHLACFHGHLLAAQWLVNRGADTTVLNSSKNSPLKVAILAKRMDVATWLDVGSEVISIESGHGASTAAQKNPSAMTMSSTKSAENRKLTGPISSQAWSRRRADPLSTETDSKSSPNKADIPNSRRPKTTDPFSIRQSKKDMMASSKNNLSHKNSVVDEENTSSSLSQMAVAEEPAGSSGLPMSQPPQPSRQYADPFAPINKSLRPREASRPMVSAASKLAAKRQLGSPSDSLLRGSSLATSGMTAASTAGAAFPTQNASVARSDINLHFACADGNLQQVEQLISGGNVDLEELNNKGMTPLYIACDKKNESIALYLIKHGANLSTVCRSTGDTPLHRLCYRGMSKLLNQILEQPALGCRLVLDCKNDTGSCPLHIAVSGFGDNDMIKYLLELGADAGVKDADGMTALHFACRSHKLDTVKLLLSWSAPINIQNKAGDTPLMLAVTADDGPIAKYLVEVKHAALTAKNTAGDTVLHLACKAGGLSMAEWLVVHHGLDPAVRNNAKLSAMSCAEMGGYDHLAAKLEQWKTPDFKRRAK